MNNYRNLTDKEIATLVVYGCSADDWKNIRVSEEFSPQFIQNVHFSGEITIGKFEKIFELIGGIKRHSGIYNTQIHNSDIADNVFIDKIQNYIANYQIEEGVYIENVNLIVADDTTTFGNGTKVSTLIESGGREVPIFDQLSAPLAYIMAFYRHNPALTKVLHDLIEKYSETKKTGKGTIGKNARIVNCGNIMNVNIGEFCQITGATSLENGTIGSNSSAPTIIGNDVQCDNFIIQSGSSVAGAALLTRCFVGQGCLIDKQFSAIDSLFFANCQGFHGEAISIFAGPYTVTHHKSTLMLTALFSFMNAGSGTNFSNHMYKLGPVHQGITERGVKTSSGSYIMWPARIGAFSVVLGKHKGNPDLQYLPFSYLIENDGESHLLPGINLHSAGTMRDVEKWPQRDKRTSEKIDPIIFDFLSPYTISKAIKGIEILRNLLENADETIPFVWYQNCKIKKSAIRKGMELYEMAIDSFISTTLRFVSPASTDTDTSEWVDVAGLLAPKSAIEQLCTEITSNSLQLTDIQHRINFIYQHYAVYSFDFCKSIVREKYDKDISNLTASDKQQMIEKGIKADKYLNDMLLRDARKEFGSVSRIGFGIDGDELIRNADFEAVRGNFENHPFIINRLNTESTIK